MLPENKRTARRSPWYNKARAVLGGRVWVSEFMWERRRLWGGGSVSRLWDYTVRPVHVDWGPWRFVRVWVFCYQAKRERP